MAIIHGVVRWSDTRKAIPNAEVSLILGTTVLKDMTDDTGRYEIRKVEQGRRYTVHVKAENAQLLRTHLEVRARRQEADFTVSHLPPVTGTSTTSTTTTRTLATSSTTATTTTTITTGTTTSSTTSSSSTISTSTTLAPSLPPPSSTTFAGTTTMGTSVSVAPTTSAGTGTSMAPTAQPSKTTSIYFDALVGLVGDPTFALNPAVNLEEARQFRRLYTVGTYVLAGVPSAIGALNVALNSSSPAGSADSPTSLPLTRKQDFVTNEQGNIDRVLGLASDNTRTESDLLQAVRSQFDLGTAPVRAVNTGFKSAFREFVALCADDLLSTDPLDTKVQNSLTMDPHRIERIYNHLKRTKRALLRLVESMSAAGTLGSMSLIDKWARIVKESLDVLKALKPFVGDDDEDRKHVWNVVAELNRASKASIDPYVVHAREGGQLLSDSIDVYGQLSAAELNDQTDIHLQRFFFDKTFFGLNGEAVSAVLRRNAQLIQENWIPAWA